MIRYLVVNVGCHECGVGHQIVGLYQSVDEAVAARDQQDGWRDGGQSIADIFEVNSEWNGTLPDPLEVAWIRTGATP